MADARRAHVLVVDDAPEMRDLFADVLAVDGHRATCLAAAPTADEVAALAPDLVILDLLLGADAAPAVGLVRALRADARTAAVPVVVCSAAPRLLRELGDVLGGLVAWTLEKPFELDDLLRLVAACLGPDGAGAAGR